MSKPLVAIVMGSDSDLEIMREAARMLEEFGVAYEVDIASAHRSPARTAEFARAAAGRGLRVIIAGAGGAPHPAGATAPRTPPPGSGRPVPPPRVRAQAVSEPCEPHHEQRCRRGAAAAAHARVLRLLRLAFVGPRTLAAGAAGAQVSRGAVRRARARRAARKLDGRAHRRRSEVSAPRRPAELRAPVWTGLAHAARRRVARVGPRRA